MQVGARQSPPEHTSGARQSKRVLQVMPAIVAVAVGVAVGVVEAVAVALTVGVALAEAKDEGEPGRPPGCGAPGLAGSIVASEPARGAAIAPAFDAGATVRPVVGGVSVYGGAVTAAPVESLPRYQAPKTPPARTITPSAPKTRKRPPGSGGGRRGRGRRWFRSALSAPLSPPAEAERPQRARRGEASARSRTPLLERPCRAAACLTESEVWGGGGPRKGASQGLHELIDRLKALLAALLQTGHRERVDLGGRSGRWWLGGSGASVRTLPTSSVRTPERKGTVPVNSS